MDKLLSARKLMFVIKSFFCVTLAAFAMEASAGWVYVTKTKCKRVVVGCYYVKPRCCTYVRPRCCTYNYNSCNRCGSGLWGTYGGYGYY